MLLFIAGATGVLGRRMVPKLIAQGHQVRGVARNAAKADQLRAQGAQPVEVDLLDPLAVRRAVEGVDGVVHAATKIPPLAQARRRSAWAENDRLRTEGTRLLVDAALAAGVSLFLKESITFTYPDKGDEWITEDTPLSEEAGRLASAYDAERETRRFEGPGRRALILRFGAFHEETSEQMRDAVRLLRRRIAPVLGPPEAYWSIIHVEDAARAVVAALGLPSGPYNVVDDEPLRRRDYANVAADALGLPHPHLVPSWVAKVASGGAVYMMRSQRVSNRRFREASGWAPRFPSARETWRELAPALAGRR